MSAVSSELVFFLNGKKVVENGLEPDLSLIQYLRQVHKLTGTKLGCNEGGCGACTVLVSHFDASTRRVVNRAVNACLAPAASIDGCHVITVEGLGNTRKGLHPVQARIAEFHGSQCGFCTPGIVMSLYAMLRNNPTPTMHEIEECFDGNLCRCTGYRPILDAAKTFAVDHPSKTHEHAAEQEHGGCGMENCCQTINDPIDPVVREQDAEAAATVAAANAADPKGPASDVVNRKLIRSCSCSKGADYEPLPVHDKDIESAESELIFPPALALQPARPLLLAGARVSWLRPVTLRQLLRIKKTMGTEAKLVQGNTEVGIEVRFKNAQYTTQVAVSHVKELNSWLAGAHGDRAGVHFGAAINLTDIDAAIGNVLSLYGQDSCGHLLSMRQQLKWFASRQIRNVACIAGNLVTASPISDLNPVLQAADAVVTLAELDDASGDWHSGESTDECGINGRGVRVRHVRVRDFFLAYRKVDIRPTEVMVSVFVPFTRGPLDFARAFKQARRRDDDISIVTSAFTMQLRAVENADTEACEKQQQFAIADVSLSFGGVGPCTRTAPLCEEFLRGKVFNAQTFENAYEVLAKDIDMAANAPGGQVEYRRTLCSSFLFKFYLHIADTLVQRGQWSLVSGVVPNESELAAVRAQPRSGLSHGAQEYQQTPQHMEPVGQSVIHASARLQVTGEAKYLDDMPEPPGMLFASVVLSSKPHARIVKIDTSAALAVPGAVKFIGAADVTGSNVSGEVIPDEEVFASKEVHTVGQLVGLLVATTPQAANAAARLVKIDYEDLPAVLSIRDAIACGSFFPFAHEIGSGDGAIGNGAGIEAALKASSHIVTGECAIGGQEHFYFETNACLCVPGEMGEMTVHASTQNPTSTQEWAAHALGVPSHRVVCKVKRLGGGFGGKETRSIGLTSAVAVAAQNLDRPVKCVMERYQDMMFSGQRHPFYARYRVGVEPNGRLNALDVEVYSNGGWSHDLSMAVMDRALFHVDNVYKIPHMRVRGRIAKTNMPSNTAFRGFGGPQGMMINEMMMDHVIRQLNLPAAPTRRLNMYAPTGDKTHFGQSIEPFNVPRIWSDLLCRAEVSKREAEVAAFNAANRYRKRGLCVLPTKFSCSFTAKFLNQGGALVLVYHDGSILVTHGGTEMGQGLHTKMAQIAATAFGVPLDVVHIAETATDKVANTSATAASMSSDINGAAVVDACNQILPRLAPYRQKFPQASFAEIVKKAYFDRVNLCAQGFHSVPWTGGYDWTLPLGTPQNPFAYFTHGVSVTEVEVDTLTGDHTVLRTDMMMDIGASLNPGVDVGQIEGAFMQGLGWCTLEELVFGDNDHPWVRPGHLFTQGPGSYKIPSFNDVPLDMRVYLLKDAPNPRAVHSSKAVGEPPLFMAASVFFAIKDAIAAAREENGLPQSWFQLHSPATSERIRMAIQDRLSLPFIANPESFVPKGSF